MGIFDTLPPSNFVLNAAHQDAQGLIHAWLFNAGSGTTVRDQVTGVNGALTGTYTWLAKGCNFNGSRLTPSPSFSLAYPYTIVAGLKLKSVDGWQCIIGTDGVTIGFLNTSVVNANVTANRWVNADAGAAANPVSTDIDYVMAFQVTYGDMTWPIYLCSDYWGDWLRADVAFIYVFKGEPDTAALIARLQTNPYAMFEAPKTSFTKLYLTNTAAPYTPATIRGTWDITNSNVKMLSPLKTNGEGGSPALSTVAGSPIGTRLFYRGVSMPLAAQTLACTISILPLLNRSGGGAGSTVKLKVHMYLTQGNSDTVRAVLVDNFVDTVNAAGGGFPSGYVSTLAQVVNQAVTLGDRLVVELGWSVATNTASGGTSCGYADGAPDASSGSSYNGSAPWIGFSAPVVQADILGRVTQAGIEVASTMPDGATPARVTQAGVEVAYTALTQANVYQQAVRTLSQGTPDARVYQQAIRTLSAHWAASGYVYGMTVRTLSPRGAAFALLSVVPDHGRGGTSVIVTGAGFTPDMGVIFDGLLATNIVVVDETTITCDAPAHAPGIVDVALVNL